MRQDKEEITDAYTYREDAAKSRLMFLFESEPEREINILFWGIGFRWSPARKAWVGRWTENAHYTAKYLKAAITARSKAEKDEAGPA